MSEEEFLAQNLPAQGNQIIINGQTLPIAWKQWRENNQLRIGISDVGLVSGFGVELLSTANPTLQPIQWYGIPRQTQWTLPVQVTSTARYVDVTEWVQELGWRMVPQGNMLRLQAPASQVLGMRQVQEAWGDRFLIALNQETPIQINHAPGKTVITLGAVASSALFDAFESQAGNAIDSIKFTPESGRTQIEINLKSKQVRPQILTANAPYRVAIDFHLDTYIPTKRIQWAPGIQWRQQTVTIGSSQFPVFWLQIDPQNPQIQLRPIRTNTQAASGTSPLVTLARQSQVAAAINAGFFNRNNRLPLGVIRDNGEWISGPILNRGAIAWNDRGQFLIDRLTLTETLTTQSSQQYPILYLNSGYVKPGLSRYTRAWGSTYTPLTDNETLISVNGDRVISQTQTTQAGTGQFSIPPQGYLLVHRGQDLRPSIPPRSRLQLQTTSSPDLTSNYPFTLGAGPLLMKNGRIVLDAQGESFSQAFIRQQASRSAIGLTSNGQLIIAAVHNRSYGKGPTLTEMAQIMQHLGTVDALNLDGGSSTGLYLGGELLDRSPRSAARIHNGLGIFLQP
ncbi:phosphodiester glycosidase family protein [Roseofilum sp. Belize Diploria]|uniref:phosphodiester glycosidase family protein n=1 Tax=Roseofilum sp. Belize Diploria TaxID=2821501 RepID=UPI001B1B13F6|nr:phosphodiester glycosidase family protein [Roseofilum sp. Belize Diploria]MBP0010333.1 phosphodiester glycosidase family protein [Roseofilum sp. Belize Diploria]